MRIFAFRSFRAAAPGLMEFTQQQRCLFICSAQPASPSTSICFSGQGSSFSTISMHFMECNETHVQSAGWRVHIILHICTPACKEHLVEPRSCSSQDGQGFMNCRDTWIWNTCSDSWLLLAKFLFAVTEKFRFWKSWLWDEFWWDNPRKWKQASALTRQNRTYNFLAGTFLARRDRMKVLYRVIIALVTQW